MWPGNIWGLLPQLAKGKLQSSCECLASSVKSFSASVISKASPHGVHDQRFLPGAGGDLYHQCRSSMGAGEADDTSADPGPKVGGGMAPLSSL